MNWMVFAQGIDGASAIQGAQQVAHQISAQEWLGPLAAVALSPFFGIALLSGIATFGPVWLQERSALIGPASPMNNPMLFWCMLGMTIATSLPRLTKVSKPLALAAEKMEAYSAVIILLAMRFVSGNDDPQVVVVHDVSMAGWVGAPIDIILGIAAAVNILVINTIKLTIELFVWMMPVPTIDAWLEIANKSICVCFMALYTYSPLLSFLLNLVIFGCCFAVFSQVKRFLIYAMELYLMPVLEQLLLMQTVNSQQFVGFLVGTWNRNSAKTRFRVTQLEEHSLQVYVESLGWFANQEYEGMLLVEESKPGLLNDQVTIQLNDSKIRLDVRRGLFHLLTKEVEAPQVIEVPTGLTE